MDTISILMSLYHDHKMNPSDHAVYQAFIDQLLTYDTVEQVKSQFQSDDSLLTSDLLHILVVRLTETNDGSADSLTGLIETVTALYNEKCLFIFLNSSNEEAVNYAHNNLINLANHTNYEEIKEIKSQYAHQPYKQHALESRIFLLAIIIINTCLNITDWPERRYYLTNGWDWIKDRKVIDWLETIIADVDSINKNVAIWIKDLLSQTKEDDIDDMFIEMDALWLYVQSQNSPLDEKIDYLVQAIELLNNRRNEYWANLCVILGGTYIKYKDGGDQESIENAIKAYQNALQVYSRNETPEEWADIQDSLGTAWRIRICGDHVTNIELAIESCQKALQVRTHLKTPEKWANTQFNLGNAYMDRLRGDHAENIERAFEAYQNALKVYSHLKTPEEWAEIQNNLGVAWRNRLHGDRAENIEYAFEAYQNALKVRTQQKMPKQWADTQNNLGSAWIIRVSGDRAENIEHAIEAYRNALKVNTLEEKPRQWANTQYNLGSVYVDRIFGDRAENIEQAIESFLNALQVRTQLNIPLEWADTQNNLGNAYMDRLRGDHAENIERAFEAYQNALKVYSHLKTPEKWANVQANLGNIYIDRLHGDRAENIEYAFEAYQNALKVRTQQKMPKQWADTQNNLSRAWITRLRGNPVENIEHAIEACQNALQVCTQLNMPEVWAITQTNLGVAFNSRLQGNPAKNIERAIEAFLNALQIYNKGYVHLNRNLVLLNLGTICYNDSRWKMAQNVFHQLHQSIEQLRNNATTSESRSRISKEYSSMYSRLIHCSLLLGDVYGAAEYTMAAKSRSFIDQLVDERKTFDELLVQYPTLSQDYTPIKQRRQELDELLALSMMPSGQGEGDSRSTEELEQAEENKFNKITALRIEINTLTDDLIFKYPALAAIQALPPITQADAQRLSGELGHATLVEYVKHQGGWGAFVINTQIVRFIPLADDLMTQINQSLALFFQHDKDTGRTLFWLEDDWKDRLEQIYRAVFEPLLPYLPSLGQLIIAPTQELHLVPFQALLTQKGDYISENYGFSFVPSLATLRVLHEQAKRLSPTQSVPNRLLNVFHSGGSHNPLANIRFEAQEVGMQFADPVFLGEEKATVEGVIEKANQSPYQVVHFNCHGSFLPDNPLHSGLLLAQQRMLTVNDIRVRIRLQGRPLVTLSACQTGQTLPQQGDETTGLSWAFLAAGASSVLSSQWSVPDASTRELFKHFYQLRRQSGVSDAEALQQAMLQVRKRKAYQNRPEFWAGFQVMGLPVFSL